MKRVDVASVRESMDLERWGCGGVFIIVSKRHLPPADWVSRLVLMIGETMYEERCFSHFEHVFGGIFPRSGKHDVVEALRPILEKVRL